ncbi:hypothetical protein N7478_012508 [Penicillium angulare]|uniref:uncharacterized protein n=1 Tax=Penicillium angulare TaxID=116970 RepID=UPI00253FE715|nr:uncharacterized protein N7478_012508 [Penicillium angulare]KAJ5259527.1 hypothetical protein N7478_012508 [Penicillium angulare]
MLSTFSGRATTQSIDLGPPCLSELDALRDITSRKEKKKEPKARDTARPPAAGIETLDEMEGTTTTSDDTANEPSTRSAHEALTSQTEERVKWKNIDELPGWANINNKEELDMNLQRGLELCK